MSKRFLIILAVLILGFLGFVIFQGRQDNKGSGGGNSAEASNHTSGEGTKGVTLVEYGDFQCPSCGAYFPVVEQVRKKYGDEITFQFRHFPLTQIHPNAMAAHRAAEAASKQGKFWEMYDILYERQNLWSSSSNVTQMMEDYATELGINVDQFKSDYQSAEVNAVINADISAGSDLKITGTPTFFLNGQKLENLSPDLNSFTKVIDEAIQKQNNQ